MFNKHKLSASNTFIPPHQSLAGLQNQLWDRLQSVQNATSHLIFTTRHQDHIQRLLCSLHRFCSGWWCWCIDASTALHPATWRQISSSSVSTSMHVGNCTTRLCQPSLLHAPCRAACYHQRPCLPGSCSVCLEQSARISSDITITASFPQETEDGAFCSVLQLF